MARHPAVVYLFLVRAMATARFPLALCISLAAATSGCAAKLPASAEALLLRHFHAQKIIAVHDVRRRTIDGFDYLGVFATFKVESNCREMVSSRGDPP